MYDRMCVRKNTLKFWPCVGHEKRWKQGFSKKSFFWISLRPFTIYPLPSVRVTQLIGYTFYYALRNFGYHGTCPNLLEVITRTYCHDLFITLSTVTRSAPRTSYRVLMAIVFFEWLGIIFPPSSYQLVLPMCSIGRGYFLSTSGFEKWYHQLDPASINHLAAYLTTFAFEVFADHRLMRVATPNPI